MLGHLAILRRICPLCGERNIVSLPAEAFAKWRDGAPIQVAWPEGTADQREAVTTGMHGKCYDNAAQEGN